MTTPVITTPVVTPTSPITITTPVVKNITTTTTTAPNPTEPSFISTVPQGNYTLTILNSNLPSIRVLVGQKGIGFTGCNSINVPCQASTGNLFKVLSATRSTNNQCIFDNDLTYVQLLKLGDKYVHSGNSFYLTTKGVKLA